jgi:hypothetical protein
MAKQEGDRNNTPKDESYSIAASDSISFSKYHCVQEHMFFQLRITRAKNSSLVHTEELVKVGYNFASAGQL